jgi:hypothetical protein
MLHGARFGASQLDHSGIPEQSPMLLSSKCTRHWIFLGSSPPSGGRGLLRRVWNPSMMTSNANILMGSRFHGASYRRQHILGSKPAHLVS